MIREARQLGKDMNVRNRAEMLGDGGGDVGRRAFRRHNDRPEHPSLFGDGSHIGPRARVPRLVSVYVQFTRIGNHADGPQAEPLVRVQILRDFHGDRIIAAHQRGKAPPGALGEQSSRKAAKHPQVHQAQHIGQRQEQQLVLQPARQQDDAGSPHAKYQRGRHGQPAKLFDGPEPDARVESQLDRDQDEAHSDRQERCGYIDARSDADVAHKSAGDENGDRQQCQVDQDQWNGREAELHEIPCTDAACVSPACRAVAGAAERLNERRAGRCTDWKVGPNSWRLLMTPESLTATPAWVSASSVSVGAGDASSPSSIWLIVADFQS